MFTTARGRDAVFWQSPRTRKQARPSVRTPTARAGGITELAALPRAAVVVEDRYSAIFKLDRIRPALITDGLAELQVRWPNVPIVFCETRRLAEEWTYRFLAAAQTWADTEDAAIARIAPGTADALAGAAAAPGPATAEVRAWARGQGIAVPERGRLRPDIWDAWRAAHPTKHDLPGDPPPGS